MNRRWAFLWYFILLSGGLFFAPSSVGASLVFGDARNAVLELGKQLSDEGKWAEALEVFRELEADPGLSPRQRDWLLAYRLNARWRAVPEVSADAQSAAEAIRQLLRKLEEDPGSQGALPAFLYTSLGDFLLASNGKESAVEAWRVYGQALELWAGSTARDAAREAYLEISLNKLQRLWEGLGHFPPGDPPVLSILENAERIASEPSSLARAHFLQGRYLEETKSEVFYLRRAGFHYGEALRLFRETGHPDEASCALRYADWASRHGRDIRREDGSPGTGPDYELSLDILRSIQNQASPEFSIAAQRIEDITRPTLDLEVAHTFQPGTEIAARLTHRNLSEVRLQIFKVDVLKDAAPERHSPSRAWGIAFPEASGSAEPAMPLIWENLRPLRPPLPHQSVREMLRPGLTPEPGAYLVVARAGNLQRSALLLVTEAALLVSSTPDDALLFLCDALSGEPIPNAPIRLWQVQKSPSGLPQSEPLVARTGADGLALFNLANSGGNGTEGELWAAAGLPNNPVTLRSATWTPARTTEPALPAFAVSQQNHYRPGQQVSWKFFLRETAAREFSPATPRNLPWQLTDSRGNLLHEGHLKLNERGTAAESFQIPSESQPGEVFLTVGEPGLPLFQQSLFEILPTERSPLLMEIEWSSGGEDNPGSEPFRVLPGQRLEGMVRAAYAAGSPVTNAEVRLEIVESPLNPLESTTVQNVTSSQTLRLDSRGVADFTIPTAAQLDHPRRYALTASLNDPGTGAMGQARISALAVPDGARYDLNIEKTLYLPGQTPQAVVTAQNLLGEPLAGVSGELRLVRLRWVENWIDGRGRQISGGEMRALQANAGSWFYFGPNPRDFRLENEGYRSEIIARQPLSTSRDGTVAHTFRPLEPGYYAIEWSDAENRSGTIKKDFWVAPEESSDIGYRSTSISLLADRTPVRPPVEKPFIVAASPSHRWSLLTLSDTNLRAYKILQHAQPVSVQKITLPAVDVPQVDLELFSVSARSLFKTVQAVPYSQAAQQLSVELKTDREDFRPGQELEMQIQVRDSLGSPVPEAEIAFALRDLKDETGSSPTMSEALRKRPRSQSLHTVTSLIEKPFFQPLATPQAPTDAPYDDSSPGAQDRREATPTTNSRELFQHYAPGESQPSPFWEPSMLTDGEGMATIQTRLPESLTSWVARAWAIDAKGRHGETSRVLHTRLPLSVDLDAPSFLREGDAVWVEARLVNNLATAVESQLKLHLAGPLKLKSEEAHPVPAGFSVTLEPRQKVRQTWPVHAASAGEGTYRLAAVSDAAADALQVPMEVLPQSLRKMTIRSGRAVERSFALTFDASPEAPAAPQILLAPGLAPLLLDGVAEALQRPRSGISSEILHSLPALWVVERLQELGFPSGDVRQRLIETLPEDFLQAQSAAAMETSILLRQKIQVNLEKLSALQNKDGGWPWRAGGPSDFQTSREILQSLFVAQSLQLEVDARKLESARAFMARRLTAREGSNGERALALLSLATRLNLDAQARPARYEGRALLELLLHRKELEPSALAALALVAQAFGIEDESQRLLRLLKSRVREEKDAQNKPYAHWEDAGEGALNPLMCTALALRALATINPADPGIESALNWLLANKDNPAWKHSSASFETHRTLLAYLEATGEIENDLRLHVTLNETSLGEINIPLARALGAPQPITLPASLLKAEDNRLVLSRRREKGVFYHRLTLFEPTAGNGQAMKEEPFSLDRHFFRVSSTPTLLKGFREQLGFLESNEALDREDAIEVHLWLKIERPFEKIRLHLPLPAGFEPSRQSATTTLQARRFIEDIAPALLPPSGTDLAAWLEDSQRFHAETISWDAEWSAHQLDLFTRELPKGLWVLRFRLNARHAGSFTFPPATVQSTQNPAHQARSSTATLEVLP
jgi:alpha-2-macroglobulin